MAEASAESEEETIRSRVVVSVYSTASAESVVSAELAETPRIVAAVADILSRTSRGV